MVRIPSAIKLGQTIDFNGKLYSNDCIDKKSFVITETHERRDNAITNDYYPYSFKEWALWKRMIFFWEQPPPKRILYRGSFEISGYSKVVSADFKLTEKARDLAIKNIYEFYKIYGSHYVKQIKNRRGFVYYFFYNTDKDQFIDIIPFGLSDNGKKKELPVSMNDVGNNKINTSCLPNFSLSSHFPNLLKPKNVKEFFENKERMIELFNDDSSAIPIKLSIEPWSEYFKANGISAPSHYDFRQSGDTFGHIETNEKSKYSGQLENNVPNGEGILSYSDGAKYSGSFRNGSRHGIGTIKWNNGDKFIGAWINDKREGFGIYYWNNGDKYLGEYAGGEKNGNGKIYWKNGEIYSGGWRNNTKNGIGVLTKQDGMIYNTIYQNDNLIKIEEIAKNEKKGK